MKQDIAVFFTEFIVTIGGDLVQVLGGRGRRISAEKFFIRPPMRNLGGRRGTHCYLELNVGSVLSVLTLYILLYFALLRLICASFVGSG